MTNYLLGADQKNSSLNGKTGCLEGVEAIVCLGIKSWFTGLGLNISDTILGHLVFFLTVFKSGSFLRHLSELLISPWSLSRIHEVYILISLFAFLLLICLLFGGCS